MRRWKSENLRRLENEIKANAEILEFRILGLKATARLSAGNEDPQ
jgi:hypothetical protein